MVEHRVLIVIFTSSAFLDWVDEHFSSLGQTQFNPYLSFLFYAL